MLVLDHHLHPQHLRLLQCLHCLWLLLDPYHETVLVAVYHLAPLADCWVDYCRIVLNAHHFHERSIRRLVHNINYNMIRAHQNRSRCRETALLQVYSATILRKVT